MIQTHTPCYLNNNKNITYTKGVLYGIELTVIKELAILKSQESNGDIILVSIVVSKKNITYTKGVLYGIELRVIKELAILKSQESNGDIN